MEIRLESTVPISAILPPGLGVIAVDERILDYKSAMAQARRMLSAGIITEDEYDIIDTMMATKYGLSSCSLFRENDLLYSSIRGNMSHYEEVTKCQKQ